MPSGSRPPAPTPTSATTIAGCGPKPVALAVSSAAPVGVHSSIAGAVGGPAYDGAPRSSCATAGGGTGIEPCAPRTVPEPTATGETTRVSRRRCSSPAATPTTSAIASSAPTSWKCTSSGVVPCTAASATASRSKVARPGGGPLGERRGVEQRGHVVPGPVGDAVRDLHVAAGGGEPVAGHGLGAQGDVLGRHRADRVLEHVDRDARADERAEEHVPAGAGGGVDPADRACGHRAALATRAAKTPAPKPLSMLTTVTPARRS